MNQLSKLLLATSKQQPKLKVEVTAVDTATNINTVKLPTNDEFSVVKEGLSVGDYIYVRNGEFVSMANQISMTTIVI